MEGREALIREISNSEMESAAGGILMTAYTTYSATSFLKKAKKQGRTKEEAAAMLRSLGFSEEVIASALGMWDVLDEF